MCPEVKVRAVRTQPSALQLMAGRKEAPKMKDRMKLPGEGKLGLFWQMCKSWEKCGKLPYYQLLVNPLLKTDC